MPNRLERFAYLLCLPLMLWAGFMIGRGWEMSRPAPPETSAPEVRKASGDVVLAREPAPGRAAQADEDTGGKALRRVTLEALPRIPGQPLAIELLSFETPEGIRTEARSNGTIIRGLDEPLRPWGTRPSAHNWTVQVLSSWEGGRQSWGGMATKYRGTWAYTVGATDRGVFLAVGVQF